MLSQHVKGLFTKQLVSFWDMKYDEICQVARYPNNLPFFSKGSIGFCWPYVCLKHPSSFFSVESSNHSSAVSPKSLQVIRCPSFLGKASKSLLASVAFLHQPNLKTTTEAKFEPVPATKACPRTWKEKYYIVKKPYKNLAHSPKILNSYDYKTLKLCLGAYFPRGTASRYDFLRADAS